MDVLNGCMDEWMTKWIDGIRSYSLSRVTTLEEKLRDKNIKIIELEAVVRRLQQENQMIERKLDHISLNTSLPLTITRRPSPLVNWNTLYTGQTVVLYHDIAVLQ